MTKTFKGPDRFREQMEWEEANKDKFVVKQIECHNGRSVRQIYRHSGEYALDRNTKWRAYL